MARLGDICKINMGQSPDSSTYNDHGIGLPFYQGNADFGEVYPSARVYCSSPVKVAQKGDILISVRAPIGALNMANEKCCIGRGLAAITANEDVCDRQYLWYVLLSKVEELNAKGTGSTFKAINRNILDETEIPLIPIDDQKQISDQLDKVVSLISLRKKQLQKLDDLIKSRFVEMFEQGDCPEIEFGKICVFLRNGANIKQTKGAAGYPITRIETLANDAFNTDRLGYANIFELGKYESYLLKPGDILISHINSVAYLGRAVQYKGQIATPIIHGMNLLCARIVEAYNPTYIEFFFKTPAVKNYISSITKKAVNQASFTTTDLKKMLITSPPIEKQNAFAAYVQRIEKIKSTIEQGLDKLEQMKQALMQKYFG